MFLISKYIFWCTKGIFPGFPGMYSHSNFSVYACLYLVSTYFDILKAFFWYSQVGGWRNVNENNIFLHKSKENPSKVSTRGRKVVKKGQNCEFLDDPLNSSIYCKWNPSLFMPNLHEFDWQHTWCNSSLSFLFQL